MNRIGRHDLIRRLCQTGEEIFADAAIKAASTRAHMMIYNPSGSQAMHFGDQICSLSAMGYVGAHRVS